MPFVQRVCQLQVSNVCCKIRHLNSKVLRSIVECHNIIGLHCPRLTSLTFTGDHESPGVLDQECDGLLLRRHAEWQPHPRSEERMWVRAS